MAFPLHEYWLEHKRAATLELAAQREAMLEEVTRQRKSALLGIDLLAAKLEMSERAMRGEAHKIVTSLATREAEAWRKVNAKESKLYALQRQLNEQAYDLVQREKEVEMKEADSAARCNERRRQVETWAAGLQDEFIRRESELRLMTRNVESDLGVLFAARRRDVIEGSPTRHIHNFATITYRGSDLPRVVIGEPVRLDFAVSPHGPLVGMPVTMTYLEGRSGAITGRFVSRVEHDGSIHFDDIVFNGPPGSSHVVLVSISRVAAGTVEGLELPVHLKASPTVRAIGSWNTEDLTLTGCIRVMGVEPFGLSGQNMAVVMTHIPSGVTLEEATVANATNEFHFDFKIPSSASLSWDEISTGRVFIEAHVPASKFTNPFFHKFQVQCQSPNYPSFQFPAIDRQRDCGMTLAAVDLPFGDLLTDVVLCDSGTMCATADVSGCVTVFRLTDHRWQAKHRIQHETFVSVLQWAAGGSHLAVLEPKRNRVQVWSLTDLLLRGDEIPSSAEPTARFSTPLGTSLICPIPESPPACLISTANGVRLYRGKDFTDISDNRQSTVSFLRQYSVKRGGGHVAFIGYEDGELLCIGLANRKVLCVATIATKDPIMSVCPVGDSRFVVASKKALMVIGTTPAWVSMQCPFRTPSPLRGVGLQSYTATMTRLLLQHDDGHLALVSLEDTRVLSFCTLPDINGVSSICAIAAPQLATTPASEDASVSGFAVDTPMTLVGCAALRPFALTVRPQQPTASLGSPSSSPTGTDGKPVLPITYEANFKRRGLSGSGSGGSNTQQHRPRSSAAGSMHSTPRSARAGFK